MPALVLLSTAALAPGQQLLLSLSAGKDAMKKTMELCPGGVCVCCKASQAATGGLRRGVGQRGIEVRKGQRRNAPSTGKSSNSSSSPRAVLVGFCCSAGGWACVSDCALAASAGLASVEAIAVCVEGYVYVYFPRARLLKTRGWVFCRRSLRDAAFGVGSRREVRLNVSTSDGRARKGGREEGSVHVGEGRAGG